VARPQLDPSWGDWIREIERREGLWFKRFSSIIGWWEEPQQINRSWIVGWQCKVTGFNYLLFLEDLDVGFF
jgi:hypothetical protein